MNRIKNALKTLEKMGDNMLARNQKVDKMTTEICRRGYGIDPVQAKRIASILVDQAEVIWKKQ